MIKVVLDVDGQDRFREEAKKAFRRGDEYIELLGGHKGVGEFHVVQFYPIKTRTGTMDSGQLYVEVDPIEEKRIRRQIKKNGHEYLGNAHSHIDCDSSPSKHDHEAARYEKTPVIGILEMWKDKNGKIYSRWDFWQPQAPMTIEYRKSIPPSENAS